MSDKAQFIAQFAPLIAIIVAIGVVGWVITTWLRIKHGYPLEGSWGQSVHPTGSPQALKKVEQLVAENAQLRDELGGIKSRLANVERIVTDEGRRLAHEIDQLQLTRN